MSRRPRIPNLALRRVREDEFHQTRAEFAEALMGKAHELGDSQLVRTERRVGAVRERLQLTAGDGGGELA